MNEGLVPSLLTPGELVFSPQGVKEAGARNLERFNARGDAAGLASRVSPRNVSVVPGIGSSLALPSRYWRPMAWKRNRW